jgi:hypothetical protein
MTCNNAISIFGIRRPAASLMQLMRHAAQRVAGGGRSLPSAFSGVASVAGVNHQGRGERCQGRLHHLFDLPPNASCGDG